MLLLAYIIRQHNLHLEEIKKNIISRRFALFFKSTSPKVKQVVFVTVSVINHDVVLVYVVIC